MPLLGQIFTFAQRTASTAALVLTLAAIGCEPRESERGTNVITVWAHRGRPAEHEAMQRVVSAFNNAHEPENLRIEITYYPDRQYPDKVSIAAFSGSLPDVVDIDGPYVGPWAAEGILVPIDDLVSDTLREDLLDSLVAQGTYRDQLYALGAFDSALVVYYNRDIVRKVGVDPPNTTDAAWSWPEFTAALEQVKPHCTIPLSLHMDDQSDEWFTYAFSPLVWSNGGALIDVAERRVEGVLDSDRNVQALRRWQDLFEQGYAEATTTNPDPFSAGLAAFDWTGHWMLPVFEEAADLRFGVMPLPRTGEEFVCPSGSWCWGISKDCRDRARAWRVIEWFLHPEHGIKPIVEANGAVPGRKSAFKLFPEYETLPRKLFREQLVKAAHPRPRTSVYLTLTSEFARALRDIGLGHDVRDALRRAATQTQQALDRRGNGGG